MEYLKKQRLEHNIIDGAGKQTFAYGKCVLAGHSLPMPSGEGDLFHDNLSPQQMATQWVIGGSDYGDYVRMNRTCHEHERYNSPRQRPAASMPASAFLLHTQDAVVLKEGSVHSAASLFTEHYEPARGCYHCQAFLDDMHCDPNFGEYANHAAYPKFDRVFVLSQIQGNNIFHFLVENLPRIALFLQDLLLPINLDIKIHVVGRNDKSTEVPRHTAAWLGYLGIENARLVAGPLQAKEVFVPEGIGCGTPGDAYWQVNMLREQLIGRSYLQGTTGGTTTATTVASTGSSSTGVARSLSSAPEPFREGVILLINRVKGGGRPGEDQQDFKKRREAIEGLVAASGGKKRMEVKVFSDADTELISCIACTAQLFNSASVIVGVHGAGLSNMLFARAGAVLIEAVGFGNPLCYMDLAFTLGK
jgi:hypothetical protein